MRLIIIGMLTWFFLGCNDFLEEKSQSEVRPSTVTDMEKILQGEAYFTKEEGNLFNEKTDIFTDNARCNDISQTMYYLQYKNKRDQERYYFCWDKEMFNEGGGGENVSFWYVPYDGIKGCNLVLEYIDQMNGNATKREFLRGEAYALRGFYYFMLVNFFGLPYNQGNPNENLGVPIKLTSGATDEKLKRNTVAEVYKQVEKDLQEGARLMKENAIEVDFVRVNHLVAYALLSRMYLYMEDWDNALKYANLVLEEKSDLLDLSQLSYSGGTYSRYTPDEILWGCLKVVNYNTSVTYPFTLSEEFGNLFGIDTEGDNKDIRFSTHFVSYIKKFNETIYDDNWQVVKTISGLAGVDKCNNQSEYYDGGIRTAELYLNRAEVYARKYVETGNRDFEQQALQDLNELRRHRFETGYTDKKPENFANGQELLEFCLRERRRELSGEGNHRWFDLRRLGMPEIKHTFFLVEGEEQYFTLEKEDGRYVLPIPKKVRERNPNLEQN